MKRISRLIILIIPFLTILISSYKLQEKLDLTILNTWKIVVAEDAISSERYAAQEFQSLFKEATGIKLEIVNTSKTRDKNIFIGYSSEMKASTAGFEISDLGKEGLRISIKPNNIAIAGGKPRGTLYGVYEFAEKYLGIRFLTYDYTYIPPVKNTLLIPCEDYTYKPCFDYRSSYYKENISHPEFSVRLRNNSFAKDDKYGGESEMQFIVHSFYRQIPAEKYGKEHPEYFAEVGGKRLLEAYGGGPQICVSNPDVIRTMTTAVIEEIKQHPEYKNVSIVQNDNQYYCMCRNCEAINQREESPMGSHLAMVNAVADEVSKVYPEVKVGTLAYQYTRKPPKTIVPGENVMVQLCSIECDLLHPYADPNNEMNKPFADDLAAWGKICRNLWIWDYMVDYNLFGLPFPNLKSIGRNIKYYKDNKVKGVFMEANYLSEAGEMSDLRNYVASRLLWNPELDSWKLVNEFCTLYYKKSSKPILEYLEILHSNIDKKNLKARFNAKPREAGIDADFSKYIFYKFEEALKLADDETIRKRVEKASLCAYVAMIETSRGEARYAEGRLNYQSSKKYKDALKKFPELAKKYGFRYYNEDESGKIEEVEKRFNNELKVYEQGGRPAVQLKDSTWTITVLTQEEGNAVEMFYKPAKFNFLPAYENNLSSGIFREYFVKGRKDKDTMKFAATLNNNVLSLRSTSADSTAYTREITLVNGNSGKIEFKTTVANRSAKEKIYQIMVAPDFSTGKITRDYSIIRAYLKNKDKLVQFNRGMIQNHGPDDYLLSLAKDGGQYIMYNTESKKGLQANYNPKLTETLNASWMDSGSIFRLGFVTKEFNLKPGETFTFSYDYRFIDKLP